MLLFSWSLVCLHVREFCVPFLLLLLLLLNVGLSFFLVIVVMGFSVHLRMRGSYARADRSAAGRLSFFPPCFAWLMANG